MVYYFTKFCKCFIFFLKIVCSSYLLGCWQWWWCYSNLFLLIFIYLIKFRRHLFISINIPLFIENFCVFKLFIYIFICIILLVFLTNLASSNPVLRCSLHEGSLLLNLLVWLISLILLCLVNILTLFNIIISILVLLVSIHQPIPLFLSVWLWYTHSWRQYIARLSFQSIRESVILSEEFNLVTFIVICLTPAILSHVFCYIVFFLLFPFSWLLLMDHAFLTGRVCVCFNSKWFRNPTYTFF